MNVFFHCSFYNDLRRYIFSKIDNLERIVLQQNLYDVFSDVVNVTLYRGKNHLALWLVFHTFII